jgi:hypothetical protein
MVAARSDKLLPFRSARRIDYSAGAPTLPKTQDAERYAKGEAMAELAFDAAAAKPVWRALQ